MALDGFSLNQVGLGQNQTSAAMAANTEQNIRNASDLKNVDQIAMADSGKAITLEEEKKERERKRKEKQQQLEKEEEAYTLESEELKEEVMSLDFYNKFSDKLAIRVNRTGDVIELYSKETKKTVETITSTDLVKIINKLKVSSGILVNKRI